MVIYTFMSRIFYKISMNLKASKSGFKKGNNTRKDYVHCCVISSNGNSLLHFV